MKFNYKIIFTWVLIILFLSCTSDASEKTDEQKTTIRNKAAYEKQIQQIETLKRSMTEYMKAAQPSYTAKDIEQCERILTEYVKNIDNTKNKETGLQVVKMTVIKLNELNEQCDFQLIETGERELITEIIISTGNIRGYNSLNEDITEAWRAW